MSAAKPEKEYQCFNAAWRGIDLEIRHLTGRFAGFDHIEVISADRVPLPITETGYQSLFILPERIAEIGTPIEYVLAWLEHEAQAEDWKRKQDQSRQMSLF